MFPEADQSFEPNSNDVAFPSDFLGPSTPNMSNAANLLENSELSPPLSQERRASEVQGDDREIEPLQGEKGKQTMVEGGASDENVEKEPGWGWKNPKAMLEYQRASEQVIDKTFSLSESLTAEVSLTIAQKSLEMRWRKHGTSSITEKVPRRWSVIVDGP